MFLGDGWGVPTLTAARILKGQERDNLTFGEEGQLHVDTFPFSGTSKVCLIIKKLISNVHYITTMINL